MDGSGSSGIVASAGALGLLALAVGFAVLVVSIVLAVRRTSRGPALALVAMALVPYLVGGINSGMGEIAAQAEIMRLGPAVTPKDLAHGQRIALTGKLFGAVGSVLALCGAATALSRSRP